MRRALGLVPLAPVALACVLLGADALLRDLSSRAHRWWAGLLTEMEGNR